MRAKEFLSRAYKFDQRINSKLEQISKLRSLTQRVTASYDQEIVSHTRNVTSLQDTIIRLIEAEEALNKEIDELVDLKEEIAAAIKCMPNRDYQLLLEKRYLSFKPLEEIAVDMRYGIRWVQVMHGRALQEMDRVLAERGEQG